MADSAMGDGFTMYNARAALESGMGHIEEQIIAIERAVNENPNYVFDLAKTLVESTCKTILKDRGIPYGSGDDLPRLFKIVTMNIPFLPVSASGEVEARRSLERTLNGLHTALQGVCEIRNKHGFASHGKEGSSAPLSNVHALLAAQTADTIIGFFHRIHMQGRTPTGAPSLAYQDNAAFNDYVDETNTPIFLFGLEYRPSEVLFAVDREAYRSLLAGFEADFDTPEDDSLEDSEEPDAQGASA